jgi:hypothetical protein
MAYISLGHIPEHGTRGRGRRALDKVNANGQCLRQWKNSTKKYREGFRQEVFHIVKDYPVLALIVSSKETAGRSRDSLSLAQASGGSGVRADQASARLPSVPAARRREGQRRVGLRLPRAHCVEARQQADSAHRRRCADVSPAKPPRTPRLSLNATLPPSTPPNRDKADTLLVMLKGFSANSLLLFDRGRSSRQRHDCLLVMGYGNSHSVPPPSP